MKDLFKKQSSLTDTRDLLQLVQMGDIQALRRQFDTAVNGAKVGRPEWVHLSTALQRNDTAMMRLLVTWGARPDKAAFADLSAADIRALRLAGVNPHDLPDLPATSPTPLTLEEKIPEPWKKLLAALQENGAPEAVIAGGALRDLDHDRPVKDVDIFLAAPVFKRQESVIRKALSAAGLTLKQKIIVHRDSYGHATGFSAKPALNKTTMYSQKNIFGITMAWTARTADDEFNIVFIKGDLAEDMKRLVKYKRSLSLLAANKLIKRFDVGLCQIAFDGERIIRTSDYLHDKYGKKLTLVRSGEETSFDHLKRLTDKYPDFKADPRINSILKPAVPKRYRPHSYGGRSMYGRGRIMS